MALIACTCSWCVVGTVVEKLGEFGVTDNSWEAQDILAPLFGYSGGDELRSAMGAWEAPPEMMRVMDLLTGPHGHTILKVLKIRNKSK